MITGLRRLRLEREMSGFDLAIIVGVQPASISFYELHKARPSQDKIDRLCEFFGVTEEELELKPPSKVGRPLQRVEAVSS